MCLVAWFFRVVNDAPLVVGANREEYYARGGEAPQIFSNSCKGIAGLDPRAHGTWFGLNAYGVLVAITNRARSELPPGPRSRGLLVRDLLGCASASAASQNAAQALGQNRYAGCNLLCADQKGVYVVHGGDWLSIRILPPGIHVLASGDVNDDRDRRLCHASWWLGQRNYDNADDCTTALQQLCGQTGNGDPPICLKGEKSGTVSSTVVALKSPLSSSTYLHAQGSPDCTPYRDYSELLGQLDPEEGPGD